MKKRKKSKLLLLFLTMTFTIAMLGTTTYAWFTANRTVTVEQMQVNVAASGGIQISENAITWRSMVDKALLSGANTTYTAAKNQIPSALVPVSTALTTSDGELNMYYGKVEASGLNYYLTSEEDVAETHTTTSGKYIAFDLFIRYESTGLPTANEPIYLTLGSGVKVAGSETDTGIKNAVRVAFLKLGSAKISDGPTASALQALNTAGEVRMWEPNFNTHTAAARQHATNTYGATIPADGHANSIAYDGLNGTIPEAAVLVGAANTAHPVHGNKFLAVTPTFTTASGFTVTPVAFTLNPATITKMRIYVWVEGQDYDCENAASGANITIDLGFTLDPV